MTVSLSVLQASVIVLAADRLTLKNGKHRSEITFASDAANKLSDDKMNTEAIAAFIALAQATAIACGRLKDSAHADQRTVCGAGP